jgi:hypothetical protein
VSGYNVYLIFVEINICAYIINVVISASFQTVKLILYSACIEKQLLRPLDEKSIIPASLEVITCWFDGVALLCGVIDLPCFVM